MLADLRLHRELLNSTSSSGQKHLGSRLHYKLVNTSPNTAYQVYPRIKNVNFSVSRDTIVDPQSVDQKRLEN